MSKELTDADKRYNISMELLTEIRSIERQLFGLVLDDGSIGMTNTYLKTARTYLLNAKNTLETR